MEWVIQLVLPLFLGAVALPFVMWRRKLARDEANAFAHAHPRALAVVVEAWRDPDGWNITYEFSPGVGRPTVRRTETIEAVPSQPAKVGDRVEVAYEPASPYHSRIMFAESAPNAV
jgi:hypothetical protein